MKFTIVILILLGVAMGAEARSQDVQNAVVKIYTVHSMPDYFTPWASRRNSSATGSGAVIKGKRILTNAHVVHDGTMIQVRRHGGSRRFEAEVLFVSHAADLAVLTVEDASFFDGIDPLEIGDLPAKKSSVEVHGFPMGGDVLSVTEGIVSRVEHQVYSHSGDFLLAIQIDAAINPGNSGGPAVAKGEVVGIAVQGINSAENLGYIIAPPVIHQFLTDIEDGVYEGIPECGIAVQAMENPGMRAFYGMTNGQSGVLVTDVGYESSADGLIQKGDVITHIDGHPIANDRTIEFRPGERTAWGYYSDSCQIGESVTFDVLRDKKPMTISVPLTKNADDLFLVQGQQYDVPATYYVYGGLVFAPFTTDLLNSLGDGFYWAIPFLPERWSFVSGERDEQVVLLRVLAGGLNEGYHDEFFQKIETVNGEAVKNLRHMINLIEAGEGDDFIVFESSNGRKIVLDRNAVKKYGERILKAYQVTTDRSEDLK